MVLVALFVASALVWSALDGRDSKGAERVRELAHQSRREGLECALDLSRQLQQRREDVEGAFELSRQLQRHEPLVFGVGTNLRAVHDGDPAVEVYAHVVGDDLDHVVVVAHGEVVTYRAHRLATRETQS